MRVVKDSLYKRWCPTCGAPVVGTERSKDSTKAKDICDNGHQFIRRFALTIDPMEEFKKSFDEE